MKKTLLILLLLFVVPFQISWAAAAAYCSHDDGQRSHFGHHVHVHQAQPGLDGDSDETAGETERKSKPAKQHHDCSVCQFSAQAALPALTSGLQPDLSMLHVAADTPVLESHILDHPAVPDWLLAA